MSKLDTTFQKILDKSGNISTAANELVKLLVDDTPLLLALIKERLQKMSRTKRDLPKPKGRRREGPHRRPLGVPTEAAKVGARAAMGLLADRIFERRIRGVGSLGSIHVHELRAIAQSQAETATSFLSRGYDDAVESIACQRLADHCVAADPFAKVRDVIKPTVAFEIFEQAKVTAAEVIRDGSARIANDLIAAAHRSPKELGP